MSALDPFASWRRPEDVERERKDDEERAQREAATRKRIAESNAQEDAKRQRLAAFSDKCRRYLGAGGGDGSIQIEHGIRVRTLTLGRQLGKGTFGHTRELCDADSSCSEFVAKIVSFAEHLQTVSREHAARAFAMECEVSRFAGLREFGPYVYDTFTCDGNGVIVMDRMEKRLDELLLEPKQFPMDVLQRVADVVLLMHDNGVFHQDLHVGNIMINRKGDVRVIDYGLSIPMLRPVPVYHRACDMAILHYGYINKNTNMFDHVSLCSMKLMIPMQNNIRDRMLSDAVPVVLGDHLLALSDGSCPTRNVRSDIVVRHDIVYKNVFLEHQHNPLISLRVLRMMYENNWYPHIVMYDSTDIIKSECVSFMNQTLIWASSSPSAPSRSDRNARPPAAVSPLRSGEQKVDVSAIQNIIQSASASSAVKLAPIVISTSYTMQLRLPAGKKLNFDKVKTLIDAYIDTVNTGQRGFQGAHKDKRTTNLIVSSKSGKTIRLSEYGRMYAIRMDRDDFVRICQHVRLALMNMFADDDAAREHERAAARERISADSDAYMLELRADAAKRASLREADALRALREAAEYEEDMILLQPNRAASRRRRLDAELLAATADDEKKMKTLVAARQQRLLAAIPGAKQYMIAKNEVASDLELVARYGRSRILVGDLKVNMMFNRLASDLDGNYDADNGIFSYEVQGANVKVRAHGAISVSSISKILSEEAIEDVFARALRLLRDYVTAVEPTKRTSAYVKRVHAIPNVDRTARTSNVFKSRADVDERVRDMLYLHQHGVHAHEAEAADVAELQAHAMFEPVVTLYHYLYNLVHCNNPKRLVKTLKAQNTILMSLVKPLLESFYEKYPYPYAAEDILVFASETPGTLFRKDQNVYGAKAAEDCGLFNLFIPLEKGDDSELHARPAAEALVIARQNRNWIQSARVKPSLRDIAVFGGDSAYGYRIARLLSSGGLNPDLILPRKFWDPNESEPYNINELVGSLREDDEDADESLREASADDNEWAELEAEMLADN
jgi:hypothetical protein